MIRLARFLAASLVGGFAFVATLFVAMSVGASVVSWLTVEEGTFDGPRAERFDVVLEDRTVGGADPARFTHSSLAALRREPPDPARYAYRLSAERATVPMPGDVHAFVVREDDGRSQIVEYYYSNTVQRWSRYRADADGIEPLGVREVGMGTALGVLLPALLLAVFVARLAARVATRRMPRPGAG